MAGFDSTITGKDRKDKGYASMIFMFFSPEPILDSEIIETIKQGENLV